jgi:hypothetical protein
MLKIFLCLFSFLCILHQKGWPASLRDQFVRKAINLTEDDMRKMESRVTLGNAFWIRAVVGKILNDPKLVKKRGHIKFHMLDQGIYQMGGLKGLSKKYLLWMESPLNSVPGKENKYKDDDDFYNAAREDTGYKEKTIRDSLYRAMYDLKKWADLSSTAPELTYKGFVPQDNESFVDTKLPVVFLYAPKRVFEKKPTLIVTTYSFMTMLLKVLEENQEKPEFKPLYDLISRLLQQHLFSEN